MAAIRTCKQILRSLVRKSRSKRVIPPRRWAFRHACIAKRQATRIPTRPALAATHTLRPQRRCMVSSCASYNVTDIVEISTADEYMRKGHFSQAMPLLDRGLQIVSPLNNHTLSHAVLQRMAYLRRALGDYTREAGAWQQIIEEHGSASLPLQELLGLWVVSRLRASGTQTLLAADIDSILQFVDQYAGPSSVGDMLRLLCHVVSRKTWDQACVGAGLAPEPSRIVTLLRSQAVLLQDGTAPAKADCLQQVEEQLEPLLQADEMDDAVLTQLAEVTLCAGAPQKAVEYGVRYLKHVEARVPDNDPGLGRPVTLLARLYHSSGDFMSSEALYRSALGYYEHKPEVDRQLPVSLVQEHCDALEHFARLLEVLEWNGKPRTSEAEDLRSKGRALQKKYIRCPDALHVGATSEGQHHFEGRVLSWWIVQHFAPSPLEVPRL